MKPYSPDLRERVVAAVDQKEGSLRRIAGRFRVGLSTSTRWLSRRRRSGSLEPKPHGGGRPRAVEAHRAERLRDLVRQQPDATLDELRAGPGLSCSRRAIFRAPRRPRISRKKKGAPASEQVTRPVRRN